MFSLQQAQLITASHKESHITHCVSSSARRGHFPGCVQNANLHRCEQRNKLPLSSGVAASSKWPNLVGPTRSPKRWHSRRSRLRQCTQSTLCHKRPASYARGPPPSVPCFTQSLTCASPSGLPQGNRFEIRAHHEHLEWR